MLGCLTRRVNDIIDDTCSLAGKESHEAEGWERKQV